MGWIAAKFPKDKQVLAFSGANPAAIEAGLKELVESPMMVSIGGNYASASSTAVVLEQGEAVAAAVASGGSVGGGSVASGGSDRGGGAEGGGKGEGGGSVSSVLDHDGVFDSNRCLAARVGPPTPPQPAAVTAGAGAAAGGATPSRKGSRKVYQPGEDHASPTAAPSAAAAAGAGAGAGASAEPTATSGGGGGSGEGGFSSTAPGTAKSAPIRTLGMMRAESARRAQGVGLEGSNGFGMMRSYVVQAGTVSAGTSTSTSSSYFAGGVRGSGGKLSVASTSSTSTSTSTASMSSTSSSLRARVRSSTENEMYGAWCA